MKAPMNKTKRSSDLVVVIIAGGVGKRFWPLSTPQKPKQFITDFSDLSLYQQAVLRARALVPPSRIIVMTNCNFSQHVRRQTPLIPRENIILEPCRRDTAPAIALAATVIQNRWPGAVMAVTPADHMIKNKAAFRRTIEAAATRARQGGLVTIGIKPSFAATGFGYLQLAAKPRVKFKALKLKRFVEKPDTKRAKKFLADGNYLWNAGIFVWRATDILEEVKINLPTTYKLLSSLTCFTGGRRFQEQVAKIFKKIKSISIDFGVMEKAREVWSIPAAFDWSDAGGWLAIKDLISADKDGNCQKGKIISADNKNSVLISNDPNDTLLCAGLRDLIVVKTPHGTLICHKDAAERIKPLVDDILNK